MNSAIIEDIVERHRGRPGGLVSILQDIQLAVGYLPEDALRAVSEATGRSLAELYGFATFHDVFRFEPEVSSLAERVPKKTNDYIYVKCPHCNHSLMDAGCLLCSLPSVRITISFGMEHGWLRISSCPTVHNFACEFELPLEGVVHFFCPHCSAELLVADNCDLCGAPMIPRVAGRTFTKRCPQIDCACAETKRATGQ